MQQYLQLYTPEQATRHDVRPGLTGLSQVNGRNAMSWQEKFQYDVLYVKNVNFWQDLKIFFLTIKVVFLREGISDGKCATAEFFNGKN